MIEELHQLSARVRDFISDRHAHGDERRFQELALEVFAFQSQFNQPYAAFCRARGITPEVVHHYREIPALLASTFKEFELTTLPESERIRVFHSSGTTGHQPSRHFHSRSSLAVYEEALLAGFRKALLPDLNEAQFLMLTPAGHEAPHSSLVYMFETIARQFSGGAVSFAARVSPEAGWVLKLEAVDGFAARAKLEDCPVVICGTAFSFVHLCDHLAERNGVLCFPAGSRVMETGGYKGRSRTVPKAELHEMIQARLGIPDSYIVSEYGMSELSSQAYDRRAGGGGERHFRFPPWACAEVISPETGKAVSPGDTGLVRIYDLANVASVLAIQTEDLAVRHEDGFELVGRATQAEARGCSLMNLQA